MAQSATETHRLILWDVDHTLLETGGVGRELYERAFEAATGRPFEHRASISGSTELRILRETLSLHGIAEAPAVQRAYAACLATGYRDAAADLRERGRALEGASMVLDVLAGRGDVQTVVTGNLREVAATKLRVFLLDEHVDLAIAAYAEDDEDRRELVKIAVRRAAHVYGDDFVGRTVMFGDTPADVDAGACHGVPVVGVATGQFSEADLVEAGATATLPNLASIERVLATIDELIPL